MLIKARNVGLLILLCVLGLFGVRFLLTSQTKPPSWRGITPGQSTQEDVIRILGQPAQKFSAPAKFVYNDAPYGAGDDAYTPQQQILFKDEKVWLIIEDRFNGSQKDLKQASEIVKQYGKPEDVLWASTPSDLRILLFCKQGIFVRGNDFYISDFFYFVPVETQQCIEEFPDYIAVINPHPRSDNVSARDPWGYSAPTDAPQSIKAVWPRPDRDLPLSAYNKYFAERLSAEAGVGVRLSTPSIQKYGNDFEAFEHFLRQNVRLYVDHQLILNTEYKWLYILSGEESELHWDLQLKAGLHEARFEYTDEQGKTLSYEWKFTLTDQ